VADAATWVTLAVSGITVTGGLVGIWLNHWLTERREKGKLAAQGQAEPPAALPASGYSVSNTSLPPLPGDPRPRKEAGGFAPSGPRMDREYPPDWGPPLPNALVQVPRGHDEHFLLNDDVKNALKILPAGARVDVKFSELNHDRHSTSFAEKIRAFLQESGYETLPMLEMEKGYNSSRGDIKITLIQPRHYSLYVFPRKVD
jgi:hypothetical protein